MSADDAARGPRTLCVGIDEAGYGPRLGPLCVGRCAAFVDIPGDRAGGPNLWRVLRGAVGRTAADFERGKIPISDSKMLKLPGGPGVRGGDPFRLLELGVLACMVQEGPPPRDVDALLEALGASLGDRPWYRRLGSEPLPSGVALKLLALRGEALRRVAARSGVAFVAPACRAMGEDRFNALLERTGNKAEVSFTLVAEHLRWAWARAGASAGERVVVAVDRQGGRKLYGGALERALVGAEVEVVQESARVSRYLVRGGGGRSMEVVFEVNGEERHLAVALASMTAKWVRELAMRRFNAHWGLRAREVKPTAGYASDALRWLEEMSAVVGRGELEPLVRRA